MVTRKALAAEVAKQKGMSRRAAEVLVNLVAAELELPSGPFSERVAGEVELIISRKP